MLISPIFHITLISGITNAEIHRFYAKNSENCDERQLSYKATSLSLETIHSLFTIFTGGLFLASITSMIEISHANDGTICGVYCPHIPDFESIVLSMIAKMARFRLPHSLRQFVRRKTYRLEAK